MSSRSHLPALMATFIAIDTLVILLRLYVRLTLTRIGYDDYAILVALAGFILMCAFCFAALSFGFGLTDPTAIAATPNYNTMLASKYFTVAQITYVASFGVVRISVALVLHRIVAGIKQMQRMLIASMVFVGVYSLGCVIVDVTQCVPLRAVWGDGTGKCISTQGLAGLAFAVSALDIASALFYAILPVWLLRGMQMSPRTKVSVGFVLGLGAVTVVFSIVRLKSLIRIVETTSTMEALDLELESFVYSVLEFGMSILTASLVGLRPLVKYFPFGSSGKSKQSNTAGLAGSRAMKGNTFELRYQKQSGVVRLNSQEDSESQRGIVKDGKDGGVWKHTHYTVSYAPNDKEQGKDSVTNGDTD